MLSTKSGRAHLAQCPISFQIRARETRHHLGYTTARAMALAAPSQQLRAAAPSLLSRLFSVPASPTSRFSLVSARQPSIPSFLLAAPVSIQLNLPSIPSLLEDIWESVLRAVPKKKTSHMKKRHRQMAGKALKDVTSLCKCPACGQTKKMHYLCPHCTASQLFPYSYPSARSN